MKAYITYSEDVVEEILARMEGGENIYGICLDPHMPRIGTVMKWARENHEGFAFRFLPALEFYAASVAFETIHISDTDPDFRVAKNRMAARQWVAGKLDPHKWGDSKAAMAPLINPGVAVPPSTDAAQSLEEAWKAHQEFVKSLQVQPQ